MNEQVLPTLGEDEIRSFLSDNEKLMSLTQETLAKLGIGVEIDGLTSPNGDQLPKDFLQEALLLQPNTKEDLFEFCKSRFVAWQYAEGRKEAAVDQVLPLATSVFIYHSEDHGKQKKDTPSFIHLESTAWEAPVKHANERLQSDGGHSDGSFGKFFYRPSGSYAVMTGQYQNGDAFVCIGTLFDSPGWVPFMCD